MLKIFSKNSPSVNYSKQFHNIKKNAEKTLLNFKSNNFEDCNQAFSLSELTYCVMKSYNTAVGPDEIRYEFLIQLPSCSLDFLLQAFNEVWVNGKFPTSWKQATIIPIPKPGKDNTDPSNYRPIALTNCLSIKKTLERLINTRLICFWKVMVLLLTSSVASGANGVQLIIWSVWKRLSVKLSSRKNI